MSNYESNKFYLLDALREVLDRIEGQYSNIPDCCIDEFVHGSTYGDLEDYLIESKQKNLLKKLKKFNYVPCRECLESKEPNELKKNGVSDLGKMVLAIIDIVKNKENKDERKPTKRSKK